MHPREYDLQRNGLNQPDSVECHPDDETLLTAAQTRARFGGVTSMCIWRWMRNPDLPFPAPLKINSRNYWRLGDLRTWQAQRASERT